MTKLKKTTVNKFNQKDYISNWLLILFGISSIDPRRCKNGNNFTYFPSKNIKKLTSLPLNEKIKQILLWKKSIQKRRETFYQSRKNLYSKIPTYSIDDLILEKFPSFIQAFEEFVKFIPVLFLILYKTFLVYQNYDFSKSFLSLTTKLQEFLSKFLKLKRVTTVDNIFKLELIINGKKIILLLPKNYSEILIFGRGKTLKFLMNFQFQLAQSVISKIFSFQECKVLGIRSYYFNRVSDNCFVSPLRYYKFDPKIWELQPKITNNNQKKFYHLLNNMIEKGTRLCQYWSFSKNLLSTSSQTIFRGIFFYIQKNLSNFSNRMLLILSRIIFFDQSHHKEILFYFSKRISVKHSIISSFLFFNFIIDNINLKVILPTLAYLYKHETVKSESFFERHSFKNKETSLLRFPKSFSEFYYDVNEISNNKYDLCLIKKKFFFTRLLFSNDLTKNFINLCFINK